VSPGLVFLGCEEVDWEEAAVLGEKCCTAKLAPKGVVEHGTISLEEWLEVHGPITRPGRCIPCEGSEPEEQPMTTQSSEGEADVAIPGNGSKGGQLDSQSGASPVDWSAIQKGRTIYRVLFFPALALPIAERFPGVSESGLAPLFLPISLLLGAAFFYYFLKTASLLGYPRTALLGILFLLFLPVANLCTAVILDRRMSPMIARRRLLSRPPTRTGALPDSVAGSPASVRLPVNRNAVAAFLLSLVFVPGLLVPPLVTAVERGAVNVPESIRMLVWQYGGVISYSPIFFLIIGPASLLLPCMTLSTPRSTRSLSSRATPVGTLPAALSFCPISRAISMASAMASPTAVRDGTFATPSPMGPGPKSLPTLTRDSSGSRC